MPAPKDNKNAAKQVTADKWIQIRVTEQEKARAEKEASRKGLSVSAWFKSFIPK